MEKLNTREASAKTKLQLSYAGYADQCSCQFGEPAMARPIPLLEGVLGYFLLDEPMLHGFHIDHFQSFNNWQGLKEIIGEETVSRVRGIHQAASLLEPPELSGLPEAELRTVMKESVVRREFEVDWPCDPWVALRMRGIVDSWEAGNT